MFIRIITQVLWIIASLFGAAAFISGICMTAPTLILLAVIPGIEYVLRGVATFPADADKMAVVLAIGFAIAGGGLALAGYSFSKLNDVVSRIAGTLLFGAIAFFFGWTLMQYYATLPIEGKVMLAIMSLACSVAAVTVPWQTEQRY